MLVIIIKGITDKIQTKSIENQTKNLNMHLL